MSPIPKAVKVKRQEPSSGAKPADALSFVKNLKTPIPVEWLSGKSFDFHACACGAVLARAHAVLVAAIKSGKVKAIMDV